MIIEPTIIIPGLHKDEHLETLCPDLSWICPLGQNSNSALSVPWPLSAAEVTACLREAKHWAESGLTEMEVRSRHNWAREEDRVQWEYRAARDECLKFASIHPAATVSQDQEALREAQRFLLFAWAQEECLLEIRRLTQRYAYQARRLQDGLRDDAPEDVAACEAWPLRPFVVLNDRDEEAHLVPSWRPVLERLALFLPVAATLCTRDKRIIEHLHDMNLCQTLLERVGQECPAALLPLRGQLLGERLPVWKVLGYTQAQAGRPWLDVERLFLLIMDGADDHA